MDKQPLRIGERVFQFGTMESRKEVSGKEERSTNEMTEQETLGLCLIEEHLLEK